MAFADFTIVAHPDFEKDSITHTELRRLYLGITHSLGKENITPLDMPRGTEARDTFYQAILHKSSTEMDSYWASKVFSGRGFPPHTTTNEKEMISLIQLNPGLIGYLKKGSVPKGLKELNLVKQK